MSSQNQATIVATFAVGALTVFPIIAQPQQPEVVNGTLRCDVRVNRPCSIRHHDSDDRVPEPAGRLYQTSFVNSGMTHISSVSSNSRAALHLTSGGLV